MQIDGKGFHIIIVRSDWRLSRFLLYGEDSRWDVEGRLRLCNLTAIAIWRISMEVGLFMLHVLYFWKHPVSAFGHVTHHIELLIVP